MIYKQKDTIDDFIFGWDELATITGHSEHELQTARLQQRLPLNVDPKNSQVRFSKNEVSRWAKCGFKIESGDLPLNVELAGVIGRIESAAYNAMVAVTDYDGIKKLVRHLPADSDHRHGIGAMLDKAVRDLTLLRAAVYIADESDAKSMDFLNEKLAEPVRRESLNHFRDEMSRGKTYIKQNVSAADVWYDELDRQ